MRREYKPYKGKFTMAPPVTREEIEAHIIPGANDYASRVNREWLEQHLPGATTALPSNGNSLAQADGDGVYPALRAGTNSENNTTNQP